MIILKPLLIIIICIFISSCQLNNSKEQIGSYLGTLGGALLGSTVGSGSGKKLATLTGAIVGSIAGKEISKYLNEVDRKKHTKTKITALENAKIGKSETWQNLKSGNSGKVTTSGNFKKKDGTICRKFSETITANKKTKESIGIACKQKDGTWIVERI